MVKILFVCLGKSCRSAAAEAVMKQLVEKRGYEKSVFVDSAGIIGYHQGEPADARMRRHAAARGIDVTSSSRQVRGTDFDDFDLIIGMDNSNIDDLKDRAMTLEQEKKIHKMTEFCRKYQDDYVPDPYYGGAAGFELVLDLLDDSCTGLLEYLEQEGML